METLRARRSARACSFSECTRATTGWRTSLCGATFAATDLRSAAPLSSLIRGAAALSAALCLIRRRSPVSRGECWARNTNRAVSARRHSSRGLAVTGPNPGTASIRAATTSAAVSMPLDASPASLVGPNP